MARIYIGRATGIGAFERHVVLKMILPERANDETSVQMFLDEARLAASLNHQNVAQVFEVGQDAGIHYLAMEYVHGQDLRALLAKAGSSGTRVPLELALTVVAGAAAGLHHAHERRNSDGSPMGIVHRDVSPSNIMIGYDGAVKLLDFGIAKATSRSVETQSGIIKGKFAYMAPEQCRGRDVDRRSDVFSLGIILYEVTTQHRCFRADSDFDTMHRIVTGDIVRPTRLVQGYPQALEAIVMKALSVDAATRYQSSGELLEAVEGFAVGARMSLSTMSLGRFMRDMFGDVAEPWLVPGRMSQPMMAREQTISNTNASGDREAAMRHEDAPLHLPPTSILEVPRAPDDDAWNAKGYPSMPPAYASPATLPPDAAMGGMGHSQPHATAHPAPGASGHMPAQDRSQPFARPSQSNVSHVSVSSPQLPQLRVPSATSLPRPPGIANGSQPIPPQWAAHPGSGSGSAHNALPIGGQVIARTRQGYANAPGIAPSEISYPRYEPPPGEATPSVTSNSRLIYAGLAVLLIGIIVILAISIADSSDELPVPPRRATPTEPAPQAAPPQQANGGTLTPEPVKPEAFHAAASLDAGVDAPVRDESIVIHVVSTPPGADVLLAGKPIGTTPLETKIQRGTGSANLTVHHARFVDVTTAIDLTTDFRKEVTLTPVAEDKPADKVADKTDKKVVKPDKREDKREPASSKPRETPKPAAPKCQSPSQYNPFDRGCNGAACPPCS